MSPAEVGAGVRADRAVELAVRIMGDFAERTGLVSARPPVRYLWTDAFAVCAYLGLHAATGDKRFLSEARSLVDQVHLVLGRHRPDDPRNGWISGLPDEQARDHPTAGGLRIGKPVDERAPGEPYRPAEEWDRDGQYYHYLTKWMFALHRMASVTGDPAYGRWAVELARVAHRAFRISAPGGPRLVWKMSIDLSRPLVPSSGQHDPLDGLVTASVLAEADVGGGDGLAREIDELTALCRGRHWSTSDPLGVGSLLVDTLRCGRLAAAGNPTGTGFFAVLVSDVLRSVRDPSTLAFGGLPAEARLAFRELGLALGFRAADRLSRMDPPPSAERLGRDFLRRDVEAVGRLGPLGPRIVDFWSRPESRRVRGWTDHRDISDVMWATCLVPDGVLAP